MGLDVYTQHQEQSSTAWPRVDMVLALYEESIRKLERASEAFQTGETEKAKDLLGKVQLMVQGLASGVLPDGSELTTNMLRLHEFVLHCLSSGGASGVNDALRVLRPLAEAFQGIREEAIILERLGEIPILANGATLEVSA